MEEVSRMLTLSTKEPVIIDNPNQVGFNVSRSSLNNSLIANEPYVLTSILLNKAVPGSIWMISAKMNLEGERDVLFGGYNWVVDNTTSREIDFKNINGDWSSHILCGGFHSEDRSNRYSSTSFSGFGYYIVPEEKEQYNDEGAILSLAFKSYSDCIANAYLQALRIV
jgi:hypothetical protein